MVLGSAEARLSASPVDPVFRNLPDPGQVVLPCRPASGAALFLFVTVRTEGDQESPAALKTFCKLRSPRPKQSMSAGLSSGILRLPGHVRSLQRPELSLTLILQRRQNFCTAGPSTSCEQLLYLSDCADKLWLLLALYRSYMLLSLTRAIAHSWNPVRWRWCVGCCLRGFSLELPKPRALCFARFYCLCPRESSTS